MATATFAGGCFWCTEAVFQRLKGVTSVTSGYANSATPGPSYEQVASGTTGAAESLQIQFDPDQISFETLLEVFLATHDPTTPGRQGADVGSQYRSAIFYHDEPQMRAARKAVSAIPGTVTEISSLKNFTPAENYHQNYYNSNQSAPYCRLVINPKLQKLFRSFPDLVKQL